MKTEYFKNPFGYERDRDLHKVLNVPVSTRGDYSVRGTRNLIKLIDRELIAECINKKTNNWTYNQHRQLKLQEARIGETEYLNRLQNGDL